MEVVRQRGIEMSGGESQAVHRAAEWGRRQGEGMQASPLASVPQPHDTIVGGAGGQQVVAIGL